MSSKHTIGQRVSVDEQTIECDEAKQFEVVEETPELRPSVEQTIQGKVDTNHPDGVYRGLTLAAEERLVAREKEITRTRERWDRTQDSEREAQCWQVAGEASRERWCAFQERAASVDPWCDPERGDPREELAQEQLAAVNKQAMRLVEKLDGRSRAAISRRLAERSAHSIRVELGHLEGTRHLCVRCSLGGLATYWTRDLDEHLVRDATSQ